MIYKKIYIYKNIYKNIYIYISGIIYIGIPYILYSKKKSINNRFFEPNIFIYTNFKHLLLLRELFGYFNSPIRNLGQ